MYRNGFHLPALKSTAASEVYLNGVRDGKYFCPETSDILLLPYFSPPTKAVLILKLKALAEKNEWNLGFGDENYPDKAWMIKILSTFSKKDEILAKSYIAPTIKKRRKRKRLYKFIRTSR